MYEKPVQITKKIKRLKTVKPARKKMIDTGKREVITTVTGKGLLKKTVKEERPILEPVFIPAVREEIEEDKIFYAVKIIKTGEQHEFATREEANRFIRESS